MDTEEQTGDPSAEYLKGFNEGYIIAKEKPELAASLLKSFTNSSERTAGFKDGNRQSELDKDKQHYPEWMQPHQEHLYDTPDIGIDKEDIDLDVEPGQ
jgi:hypothetical protein